MYDKGAQDKLELALTQPKVIEGSMSVLNYASKFYSIPWFPSCGSFGYD